MIILKLLGAALTVFLVLFTIGCSRVYDVSYDYNPNIDLNRLKTYDWLRVPEKDGIKNLDVVRIKDAVNAELASKGLMKGVENPDFLIAVYLETNEKVRIMNRNYVPDPGYYRYWRHPDYRGYRHYDGYRGYRPHRGYRKYAPYGGYRRYRDYGPYSGFYDDYPYPFYRRYGGATAIRYQEGTLILDFIDPELKEVIWQGSAKSYVEDSMTTEKRQELIYNAVRKILKNFPPAS